MKQYKKVDLAEVENEGCELKSYMKNMNLASARLRFKIRTKMTPTVQMNFKSDKKFASQEWKCVGCTDGRSDTQSHIIHCDGYADIRNGKNLENDQDLVDFFSAVIKRRLLNSCCC